MIKAIDNSLIDVFSRIVQIWSSWTGKSNFFLAKVFLILSLVLLGVDTIFLLISSSLSLESVGIRILTVIVWPIVVKLSWQQANALEEVLKKTGDDEVLPAMVYIVVEGGRLTRIIFLFFSLFVLSVDSVSLLSTGHISGGSFIGLLFVLFCLYKYILVCFNGGGGGKIRQVIQRLARIRLRRSPASSPIPA